MRRHQIIDAISIEMQKALKDYTHEDLSKKVTDAAAVDVISAVREALTIDLVRQLDALPTGSVIRTRRGRIVELNSPVSVAFAVSSLPVTLLWRPDWTEK